MKMFNEDLKWCVRRLPKLVKNVMSQRGSKVSIGGGFIRSCISGDDINDIDIFVDSMDTRDRIVEDLKPQTTKTFWSKNAVTIILAGYDHPIQIIHRWLYTKPEDVLTDFDFSICCAIMFYEKLTNTWFGEVHERYYQDLAAKRLVYLAPNRDEDVGGSVLRVLKYYRKGYNITLDGFAGTIARLVSKVEGKQSQESMTHILTGLLVEVDPNAILGSEIVRESEVTND